jgi:hypothetical protein
VRAAARSRGAGANAAPAMTAEITAKSTKIPAATINSASRPPASQASTPEPAAPDHRLTARGRAGRCLPVRSTSGRSFPRYAGSCGPGRVLGSSKNSFATAWRCRGMRRLGPLCRWPVGVVGGWGLCRGRAMAGRSGRCIVVLACRSSSPVWLGPFEAVSKFGAGAPCRVTPVAAACACVSLLY